jgi:hypothetical protein
MDPMDVLRRLAAIEHRAAGSDAERRAARLLAAELRGLGRRGVRTQTFWARPGWQAVHALLAALGVAGSVVSVDHPYLGIGLAAAAFAALALDVSGRFTGLRWLTFQRATQNVVSLDPRADAAVRLVITVPTDVPRAAVSARGPLAGATVRARARLRGHLPSVHGIVMLSLLAVAVCCGVRAGGTDEGWLGLLQLVPTVALLLAVGFFVDALTAGTSRDGATANAGAAAVALTLLDELNRRPPSALAVDLVFAGAGDAHAVGMRRWVRGQRRAGLRPEQVCVLHLAPCGAGPPVWWTREGLVLALRYHPRLIEHCEQVARGESHLGARPHQTRTTSGARAARSAGWPAIAIGSLPRSGASVLGDADSVEAVDPGSLRAVRDLALGMIRRLDSELATGSSSDARAGREVAASA